MKKDTMDTEARITPTTKTGKADKSSIGASYKRNVKVLREHKTVGGRFGGLHSLGELESLEAVGMVPQQAELDYAYPKKNKPETLFINAINVSAETSIYLQLARRPLSIGNSIDGPEARKDHVRVQLELIDARGDRYSMAEDSIVDFHPTEYRASGCLTFEVLDGLRLGRLRFFGFLRRNAGDLVFVRFRLLCHFSSRPFDSKAEFDEKLMAGDISRAGVTCGEKVDDWLLNQLEQTCHLKGTIQVEPEEHEEILSFHGVIGRRLGATIKQIIRMMSVTSNGLIVQLSLTRTQVEGEHAFFRTGWANFRSRGFCVLRELSLAPEDFARLVDQSAGLGDMIHFTCKFEGQPRRLFRFEILLSRTRTARWHAFKVDGHEMGMCLLEREVIRERPLAVNVFRNERALGSLRESVEKAMLVVLTDEVATYTELVGRKAVTLAQIQRLARQLHKSNRPSKVDNFGVPTTVVVTTNAYQLQIEAMGEMTARLAQLEALIHGPDKSMVSEVAAEFVDWFARQPLDDFLHKAIVEKILSVFENEHSGIEGERLTFALRPSALTPEEDDHLNSFTEVHLWEQPEAVGGYIMRIWASQFTFSMIGHRLEGGQQLNRPLAICIQTMIVNRANGKLITCDPTTGDQRKALLIEPDYFNQLKVGVTDNTSLVERTVTTANLRRWSRRKPSSFQQGDEIYEDARSEVLKEAEMIAIANVGLAIQQHYGKVQEVSWGLTTLGGIYVYNSLEVPLDEDFSDYELLHELDTPLVSEVDRLVQAHWIEALPGPVSYPLLVPLLTNEFLLRHFLRVFNTEQDTKETYDPYRPTAVGVFENFIFINLNAPPMPWLLDSYINGSRLVAELLHSMFGHTISDAALMGNVIKDHISSSQQWPHLGQFSMLYRVVTGSGSADLISWQAQVESWGNEMIAELHHTLFNDKFGLIVKYTTRLWTEVGATHLERTWWAPIVTTWLIRQLLATASNSSSEVALSYVEVDVNRILEHCSSGGDELGASLRRVVASIDDRTRFANLDDVDAQQRLARVGSDKTKEAWQAFLDVYGRRSARELDPSQGRWEDEQLHWVRLVKTLAAQPQPLVEPSTRTSGVLTIDQLLLSVRTPLSWWRRFLLKNFFIGWAQRAIEQRRQTRRTMAGAYDRLREAMNNLGKEMATRGFLPEEKLIYFLKADELNKILNGHSERKWLEKARQRRRLHAGLEHLRFDEFAEGGRMSSKHFPTTAESNESLVVEDEEICLQGTPITKNSIEGGRVAVVRKLDDLPSILQKGDILITYSMDIEWQPYLYLLSGVVIERSPGPGISELAEAVRSLGLPCLVAIGDVCDFFRTGDQASIDGRNGVLKRSSRALKPKTVKKNKKQKTHSKTKKSTGELQELQTVVLDIDQPQNEECEGRPTSSKESILI